jgi:hypothetical protein
MSDFGGGDPEGETTQVASTERGGQRGFRLAGARDYDETGQLREFFGVTPLRQQGGVIGAGEIEERGVGESAGVIAHGENGVGDASAADFLVIDSAQGLAGQCEAEQAQSLFGRSEFGFRLEGGLGGGDEEQAVQIKFFTRRLGDEEMAEVDRVEGAAEEPDFVHGARLARIFHASRVFHEWTAWNPKPPLQSGRVVQVCGPMTNRRLCLIALCLMVVCGTGCSTTAITNLTPSRLPRKESGQYQFAAEYSTRQQSLIKESMQAFVIVGNDQYPMQRTPMLTNRWETLVPIPAEKDVVTYRFRFNYDYRGIPERRSDSRESKYYQLFLLE